MHICGAGAYFRSIVVDSLGLQYIKWYIDEEKWGWIILFKYTIRWGVYNAFVSHSKKNTRKTRNDYFCSQSLEERDRPWAVFIALSQQAESDCAYFLKRQFASRNIVEPFDSRFSLDKVSLEGSFFLYFGRTSCYELLMRFFPKPISWTSLMVLSQKSNNFEMIWNTRRDASGVAEQFLELALCCVKSTEVNENYFIYRT